MKTRVFQKKRRFEESERKKLPTYQEWYITLKF